MKGTVLSLVASICAIAAAGCSQGPDVATAFDAAHAAVRPTSDDAAKQAVIKYFAATSGLDDPRRYHFDPPVNNIVDDAGMRMPDYWSRLVYASDVRKTGWFMCGVVSIKDSRGGYGPRRPFYAHFDPAAPDTVQDGAVETGEIETVGALCRDIYGLAYLPQYEPE